jgi:signal recognition particle GTPase
MVLSDVSGRLKLKLLLLSALSRLTRLVAPMSASMRVMTEASVLSMG